VSAAAKTKARGRKNDPARAKRNRLNASTQGQIVEPTPELAAKHDLGWTTTDRAGVQARWVRDQRQLDALWNRGQLTVRQKGAGLLLYREWRKAKTYSAVTAPYDGQGGGGSGRKHGARPERREAALWALNRYLRALGSLPPSIRWLVKRVSIEDYPPTVAAKWSADHRRALAQLQDGLDKLADYYGFERGAQ
jgi:hypothetical protein